MQNIPNKGVNDRSYYLQADYPVTGLTESVREVKVRTRESDGHFPSWGAAFLLSSFVPVR
jgi:hypothetical protein